MKNSYTKQLKLVTTRHGIEKLVKKPKGAIKSSNAAWQNGSEKSKVEASKTIHQFPIRQLHPCELFQKFTMLSVRMILPRLQRHSRSFQRKPPPSPKGPPASFMPTPGDVQRMSSCAATVDPENPRERVRYYRVRSPSDIDWNYLLEEQLEPNLMGGPRESTSFDDLCVFRKRIRKMDNHSFSQIYPKDNINRVVQGVFSKSRDPPELV